MSLFQNQIIIKHKKIVINPLNDKALDELYSFSFVLSKILEELFLKFKISNRFNKEIENLLSDLNKQKNKSFFILNKSELDSIYTLLKEFLNPSKIKNKKLNKKLKKMDIDDNVYMYIKYVINYIENLY
jgi:hypothetical protein